jgi:DNA-binding transcriptional regulator LsrR (DeoR family)
VRTKSRLTKEEKMAIAWLAGRETNPYSQEKLCARFGVTQSSISRAIKLAQEKGWLTQSRLTFHEKEVKDSALLAAAKKLEYSSSRLEMCLVEKKEHLQLPRLPIVRSFSSALANSKVEADYPERLDIFGRNVASFLVDLLRRSEIAGITWGHTVGSCVVGIENSNLEDRTHRNPAHIVPLCGEPLSVDTHSQFSSTTLAHNLLTKLHGDAARSLPLSLLPAFIPSDFSAQQSAAIWKLIAKMHSYTEIFGSDRNPFDTERRRSKSKTHIASKLSMILTSVSQNGKPMGDGRGPLFDSSSLSEAEFRKLVMCDIGGVLIPTQPDLSKAEQKKLKAITDRWTGLTAEHLAGCAERGHDARMKAEQLKIHSPGVVLLAVGANKAECVWAAMKMGYINYLLIDEPLEQALITLASK